MASWECLHPGCTRSGEGTWSQVDKSAAKHVEETRHGTTTRTMGSVRVRDAGGVRDVRAGGAG